jgi:hypothetical protein
MFQKDSILLGIIIGLIVPFVGYALVMVIFDQLAASGLMDEGSSNISSRRMRTVGLLAICSLIIPIQIYKNKRFDQTLRGLSFPFLLYVGLWVYTYRELLFANS